MKFGKITSKKASDSAISLGGAVAGGALSGGIVAIVPQEQKIYARGGILAAGVLGAASLKGATTTEKMVQMALLGMAIAQGGALIKHFAEPSIQVTAESTGSEKFVAGMVGLACPDCDQNYSALRSAAPVINFDDIREENLQIEGSYQEQQSEATSALV